MLCLWLCLERGGTDFGSFVHNDTSVTHNLALACELVLHLLGTLNYKVLLLKRVKGLNIYPAVLVISLVDGTELKLKLLECVCIAVVLIVCLVHDATNILIGLRNHFLTRGCNLYEILAVFADDTIIFSVSGLSLILNVIRADMLSVLVN